MVRFSLFAALMAASCATVAPPSAKATAAESAAPASDKSQVFRDQLAPAGPSMIVRKSDNDFASTLEKLQAAIDSRGFKTFAVVDHAKGAASIDKDLRPTTLVIFGNPQGGTLLMQSAQTMGIALPLKALVYENADGDVMVATTDIARTLREHGVTDRDPVRNKVAGALNAIATEAGSE